MVPYFFSDLDRNSAESYIYLLKDEWHRRGELIPVEAGATWPESAMNIRGVEFQAFTKEVIIESQAQKGGERGSNEESEKPRDGEKKNETADEDESMARGVEARLEWIKYVTGVTMLIKAESRAPQNGSQAPIIAFEDDTNQDQDQVGETLDPLLEIRLEKQQNGPTLELENDEEPEPEQVIAISEVCRGDGSVPTCWDCLDSM